MSQLHISRLTTYSLKELKAIALENNVFISGDKRTKQAWIDSLTQWEIHTNQPTPTTSVEFHCDETGTTSTITGTTDTWLSDAYNSEPTEEDRELYKATQAPNIIKDIWGVEPEQAPTEAPPINPIILPFLLPLLSIGLVVIGAIKLITLLIGILVSKKRQAPQLAPRPKNLFTNNYNKLTLHPLPVGEVVA